jgi:hypothetical protein
VRGEKLEVRGYHALKRKPLAGFIYKTAAALIFFSKVSLI